MYAEQIVGHDATSARHHISRCELVMYGIWLVGVCGGAGTNVPWWVVWCTGVWVCVGVCVCGKADVEGVNRNMARLCGTSGLDV